MFSKKYKINTLIGQGSFSSVYSGIDIQSLVPVAIKVFQKNLKGYFKIESEILAKVSGKRGFPELLWHGESDDLLYIVMTLLGPCLRSRLQAKGNCDINIFKAGIKIVGAIKVLHKENYLHRDLKPENIVLGLKNPEDFYLIDFGLSKKYFDKKSHFHIPLKTGFVFRGNLIFCSNNVLSGIEPSRRDDLVSLALILLYVSKGSIPWMYHATSINDMIGFRSSTTLASLTLNAPHELSEFYKYTLSLGFYQEPDYKYIQKLLKPKKNIVRRSEFNFSLKQNKTKRNKKFDLIQSKSKIEVIDMFDSECPTVVAELPEFSEDLVKKVNLLRRIKASI